MVLTSFFNLLLKFRGVLRLIFQPSSVLSVSFDGLLQNQKAEISLESVLKLSKEIQ